MPSEHVARIVLARDARRNAQSKQMTYEMNDAFDRASRDTNVKVIVLAADGPHFCSGHDLSDKTEMSEYETISPWGSFEQPGVEGRQAREEEIYFGMCWRWRNIPKPTIAQVHGKTIAGGLMLVWVCDLIIACADATFSDPVVAFGVSGVEYFGHPWEFGARKAKEMLFTGGVMSAQEARSLGMVNHVVPREELEEFTMSLANRTRLGPRLVFASPKNRLIKRKTRRVFGRRCNPRCRSNSPAIPIMRNSMAEQSIPVALM